MKRFFLFFPLLLLLAAFTHTDEKRTQPFSKLTSSGEWNLMLKDTSGKIVSLSDFKGSFLYVDLWASWCKPCLREFDYTRMLQEKFKDDKIVWVFISFDNNEETWKRAVKANGLNGVHLFGTPVKEDIKKDLDVRGIPRYVWLDSKGSVLMTDAPRPSENGTAKQLKHYLRY